MVVENESVVLCCCAVGEALVTRVIVDETVDCTGSNAGKAAFPAPAFGVFIVVVVHVENGVPDVSSTAPVGGPRSRGGEAERPTGAPALKMVLMASICVTGATAEAAGSEGRGEGGAACTGAGKKSDIRSPPAGAAGLVHRATGVEDSKRAISPATASSSSLTL